MIGFNVLPQSINLQASPTSVTISARLIKELTTSLNTHSHSLHGKRIWLACSGGRDSLSLAHCCWQLFESKNLPFLPQLFHVNHGVQSQSLIWADQVQAWANQHAMPCHVINIKAQKNDEQTLRDARYRAMASQMNQGDVLMLAHHQDDQIETLLMRLFNGAGVTGLSGMNAWSARQVAGKTIWLWRPWLELSRVSITHYAKLHQLPYIDDPSNQEVLNQSSDDFSHHHTHSQTSNTRAWMRTKLIPIIQQRYPHANDAMSRSTYLLNDAHAIVSERATQDLANIHLSCSQADNLFAWHKKIDIYQLLELSRPRQRAVIHHWLSYCFDDSASQSTKLPAPSLQTVEQILQLCERISPDHQTIISHQDLVICRHKNTLYALQSCWFEWIKAPWETEYLELRTTLSSSDNQSVVWYCYKATYNSFCCTIEISQQQLCAMNLQAWQLRLEPYDPKQKLQLYARVGRKSGKKLAQALDIPAFMRASILLLSVLDESLNESEQPIYHPCILISPLGVHLLQSQHANTINRLLYHQDVMQIHYTQIC